MDNPSLIQDSICWTG